MTSTLHVQLFGKATMHDCNRNEINLPAKVQELLFYLLLHGRDNHEREMLCTLLWADQSPERAKKYLRQSLWQLQSAFNEHSTDQNSLLEMDGNWIQVNATAGLWSDAAHLGQIYNQTRDIPAPELTPEQATQMHKAVGLYRGDLLTGWYQDWCILERERYQSMVLALFDKLIDYAMHHARYPLGIDYARQTLQIDSARERTHRALMRLHYLSNDRSAALRQFEQCSTALMRELSVKPAKRTIELYQQIQMDHLDSDELSLTRTDSGSVETGGISSTTKDTSAADVLLNQIHELLYTMHQDIGMIKQTIKNSSLLDAPQIKK